MLAHLVVRNNSVRSAEREARFCRKRLLTFIRLFHSCRAALIAESLFLRKQLVWFQERKAMPDYGFNSSRDGRAGEVFQLA